MITESETYFSVLNFFSKPQIDKGHKLRLSVIVILEIVAATTLPFSLDLLPKVRFFMK